MQLKLFSRRSVKLPMCPGLISPAGAQRVIVYVAMQCMDPPRPRRHSKEEKEGSAVERSCAKHSPASPAPARRARRALLPLAALSATCSGCAVPCRVPRRAEAPKGHRMCAY